MAWDILQLVGVIAAVVALVIVVRLRHRSFYRFLDEYSDKEICDHLKPALTLLKSRGHCVVRTGQFRPDTPLEIHVTPAFDPRKIADELQLAEPVFVSERNVLGCREDECEIKPLS